MASTCVFPFKDISLGAPINQPAVMITHLGDSVNISCTHTYSNYYYLYWYQQTTQEKSFKLLGHLYLTTFNPEKGYDRFHIYGDSQTQATLQLSSVISEDSAVYFCAVSDTVWQHSAVYNKKLLVLIEAHSSSKWTIFISIWFKVADPIRNYIS